MAKYIRNTPEFEFDPKRGAGGTKPAPVSGPVQAGLLTKELLYQFIADFKDQAADTEALVREVLTPKAVRVDDDDLIVAISNLAETTVEPVVSYTAYLAALSANSKSSRVVSETYIAFALSALGDAAVIYSNMIMSYVREAVRMKGYLDITGEISQDVIQALASTIAIMQMSLDDIKSSVSKNIDVKEEADGYTPAEFTEVAKSAQSIVEHNVALVKNHSSKLSMMLDSGGDTFYTNAMPRAESTSVTPLSDGAVGELAVRGSDAESTEREAAVEDILKRCNFISTSSVQLIDAVDALREIQTVISSGVIDSSHPSITVTSPLLETDLAILRANDVSFREMLEAPSAYEPEALPADLVHKEDLENLARQMLAVETFNKIRDLFSWGDVVEIDGGHIKAGTIEARALKAGTEAMTMSSLKWAENMTSYHPRTGLVAEERFHLAHTNGSVALVKDGKAVVYEIDAAEVFLEDGVTPLFRPDTVLDEKEYDFWIFLELDDETEHAKLVARQVDSNDAMLAKPSGEQIRTIGTWDTADTAGGKLFTSYGVTVINGNQIITGTISAEDIDLSGFLRVGGAVDDINNNYNPSEPSTLINGGAIVVNGIFLPEALYGKAETFYTNDDTIEFPTNTPKDWPSDKDDEHNGAIWYDAYHGHIYIFGDNGTGYDWRSIEGLAGAPGADVQVEYSPDGSTEWHPVFSVTTDIYMRVRVGAGTWSDPARIVGESGADGPYTDYRFKLAATQPATPTGDNPTGWSDVPPVGSDPLWMSKATKNADGTLSGAWSDPIRLTGPAGPKGDDGSTGASAAVFSITNSAPIFKKAPNGGFSPASITLTTAYQNITGTITYQWYKDNSAIGGATSSSYVVPTSDYSSTASHTYKCTVSGDINGSPGSLSDSVTIPRLDDGGSAITVLLSNENITFGAPVSGFEDIDFSSGACVVTVYLGSTQLTYNTTGASTFNCSIAASGVTIPAPTGSGSTYSIPAPTAMSANSATATITVTVRNAAGTVSTITKVITYSLSRAGTDGSDGARGPEYWINFDFHSGESSEGANDGYKRCYWDGGTIYFSDGTTSPVISSGAYIASGVAGTKTYIYYDGTSTLKTTANIVTAVGGNKFLIAIMTTMSSANDKCKITVVSGTGTTIDGSDIITSTIVADHIVGRLPGSKLIIDADVEFASRPLQNNNLLKNSTFEAKLGYTANTTGWLLALGGGAAATMWSDNAAGLPGELPNDLPTSLGLTITNAGTTNPWDVEVLNVDYPFGVTSTKVYCTTFWVRASKAGVRVRVGLVEPVSPYDRHCGADQEYLIQNSYTWEKVTMYWTCGSTTNARFEFFLGGTGATNVCTIRFKGIKIEQVANSSTDPTPWCKHTEEADFFKILEPGKTKISGDWIGTGTVEAGLEILSPVLRHGKTGYTDTANAGFWLGEDTDHIAKFFFGNANFASGIRWSGSSLEIVGGAIHSGKDGWGSTAAGYWLGMAGTTPAFMIGDATRELKWDGALSIKGAGMTASTITGGTIQTATSGPRVRISADQIRNDTYAGLGQSTVRLYRGNGSAEENHIDSFGFVRSGNYYINTYNRQPWIAIGSGASETTDNGSDIDTGEWGQQCSGISCYGSMWGAFSPSTAAHTVVYANHDTKHHIGVARSKINNGNWEPHTILTAYANGTRYGLKFINGGTLLQLKNIGEDLCDLNTFFSLQVADLYTHDGLIQGSDRKIKKNIDVMTESGIDKVMKLKPSKYKLLKDADDVPMRIGFITDELPAEIVRPFIECDEVISGYDVIGLLTILTKAVQDLATYIKYDPKKI